MWPSVSRSRSGLAVAAVAGVMLATVVAVAPCKASTPAAVEQALARQFPGGDVVQDTLFLTDDQMQRAQESAGIEMPSRIVTRYVASRATDGRTETVGYVYVDTHIVRTLPETLLVVIDPSGAVLRVEVVRFDEPREYQPSDRWFEQFDGHELDADLQLKRSIRTLTGATLSSRAATDAVRRALAAHRAVERPDQAP